MKLEKELEGNRNEFERKFTRDKNEWAKPACKHELIQMENLKNITNIMDLETRLMLNQTKTKMQLNTERELEETTQHWKRWTWGNCARLKEMNKRKLYNTERDEQQETVQH